MSLVQQHPMTEAASSDHKPVIKYRLEAAEVDCEIATGRKVRGYAFNR